MKPKWSFSFGRST